MSTYIPACFDCVHYRHLPYRENRQLRRQCEAYPDGIPEEILNTPFIEHDAVRPNQQGTFVFEHADDDFDEDTLIFKRRRSPYRDLLHPKLSTKKKRAFWFDRMATELDGDLTRYTVSRVERYSMHVRRIYPYFWDRAYDALLTNQVFYVSFFHTWPPCPYSFSTLPMAEFIEYVKAIRAKSPASG